MKKLFSFTIRQKEIKDVEEISKDEKGNEVKTITKKEVLVPRNFFIAKPGRALMENSELFYSSKYWECVKDYNIRPSIQLQKSYLNDNGVLSEEQKKEYSDLNISFFDKQAKYQQVNSKSDKTEDEKKEAEVLLNETVEILNKLQAFENQMGSALYQNTAENIARNRTATWWMLNLSHEDKDGDFKPIFGTGDLESRLKIYDKIEEDEDSFKLEMVKKLLLAASLWYFNKAQTQEEFDLMLKMYDNQDLIEANDTLSELTPAASTT